MLAKPLSKYLSDMALDAKIKILFIPPLVILLAVSAFIMTDNYAQIQTSKKVYELVGYAQVLDKVAHNFAVERGLTAGFLGSGGQKGKDKLAAQRAKADDARNGFLATYDTLPNDIPVQISDSFAQIKRLLAQVPELRTQVDMLSADANPFGHYSAINKTSLDTILLLNEQVDNSEVLGKLNMLHAMLWLKERSGQERGAMNGVLAKGEFSSLKVQTIQRFIDEQNYRVDFLRARLPEELAAKFNGILGNDASRSVDQYRTELSQAYKVGNTISGDAGAWFAASTERIVAIKKLGDELANKISSGVVQFQTTATNIFIGELIGLVLIVAALYSLGRSMSGILRGNIQKITTGFETLQEKQDFSYRIDIDSKDELGRTGDAFNAFVGELEQIVAEVNETLAGIAVGDFSSRIERDLHGDLLELKQGVNSTSEKVKFTMEELSRVMDSLEQGDFSVRMSDQVEGDLKDKVDSAMVMLDGALSDVSSVVKSMSQGDFAGRVDRELKGDLENMKLSVNEGLDQLQRALNEVLDVSNAQRKGDLTKTINGAYEGDLRRLKDNLNDSGASLSTIVNEIIGSMNAINQGEFNSEITGEMTGSYGTLKEVFNESLGTLNESISEILHVAKAQSQGDLYTRMSDHYEGDLKNISTAINSSAEVMLGIVSKIKESGSLTLKMAQNQSESTNSISQRTMSQASSLEQIAATMEELSTSVSQSHQDANGVLTFMNQVVESIHECRDSVSNTVERMNDIKHSSTQMETFTNMIDEIAFQTNLLALNAAVESARAGEHGKGFAVVASEVRGLAQRSAEAAKEIKSLINSNLKLVNDGSDLILSSSDQIASIYDVVHQSRELLENLNVTSSEQAKGVQEINSAISQLDSDTQYNTNLVESTSQSAKTVEEQASLVDQSLAFFKAANQQSSLRVVKAG